MGSFPPLRAWQPAEYFSITIVDGQRRLLANALLDPRNTHFVLVCESTAPLFTFPFVYEYLTSHGKSFLMNSPNTEMHWSEAFLPLIPKADWGKGSAWFALQRRHARMVVADREYYRCFKDRQKFKDVFKGSYDEHYFQTLLYKRDPEGLIPWTTMAVRWQSGPHFKVSTTHPVCFDFWRISPGLISDFAGPHCAPGDPQRWRCHLFARKFSPTTLWPLLRLLPLPKALTPGEVDQLAERWGSPKAVHLPQGGVPGAGRASESYLEAWRGQLEKDKQRRGGGGQTGGTSPVLSPEEEDLFKRALGVKPAGAPRVAFLFLLRGEFLLAPLWAKFFEGGRQDQFSIYVYAGSSQYNPRTLPGVFQAAKTVSWKDASGNMTIMEGARHLLAMALLDPRNSQFVLLCEATVPLFNFSFTADFVTKTPYSFVESDPGVWKHWKKAFEPLVPRTDWRVGEPWFMLQRAHAALVASDIAYYRVFRQAGLRDDFEARSYFSTLIQKQDPGSFFNRSLVYARLPSIGPGPRNVPTQLPVIFFFWDVVPGLISDMSSPLCPYIPTGSLKESGTGESTKQPCFLFARRLHGDALDALLRVLPAKQVPYLGWGPHGEPYWGTEVNK